MKKFKCEKCDTELEVMLFMGVQPEYYVCPKCQVAFDVDESEGMAHPKPGRMMAKIY